MLPYKALDAVTSAGNGPVKDLETTARFHRMQVKITGAPSAINVKAQGSMDGENWFDIATFADPTNPVATAVEGGEQLCRYVRGRLHSISGGTSPTVTVWIGSTV